MTIAQKRRGVMVESLRPHLTSIFKDKLAYALPEESLHETSSEEAYVEDENVRIPET